MKSKQLEKELANLLDEHRFKKIASISRLIKKALKNGVPVAILANSKNEYENYAWRYWESIGYPKGSSPLVSVVMNRPTCGLGKLRIDLHHAVGM